MAQFPIVIARQRVQSPPVPATVPQRACIVGPLATLVRHSELEEKELGSLGKLDPSDSQTFAWPSRPAGSTVDLDYFHLFLDNGLFRYFRDDMGSGETVSANGTLNKVTRTGAGGFKANGPAYPRIAELGARDVQVGDWVRISAVVGGDTISHLSQVRGFEGDPTPSAVGAATPAASNGQTQSQTVGAVVQVAGADTDVELTVDASNYSSLADGVLDDIYTVEVTRASNGTDLSAARIRVTTRSGKDSATNVPVDPTPGGFAVGVRGLVLEFVDAGASAGSPTLEVGQAFQFPISDDYAVVTGTSGGTYTGTANTTYMVRVVRGGIVGAPDPDDQPQIQAVTSSGIDQSPAPINVAAADAFYALSGRGVMFKVGAGTAALRLGDAWAIPATAAGVGTLRTLVLSRTIPPDLRAESDLDLELMVGRSVEVPQYDAGGISRWEITQQGIALEAGLELAVPGFASPLPATDGDLYATARYWSASGVGTLGFTGISNIDANLPGLIHPDNPLKYGVWKALQNGPTASVYFTGVADPTLFSSWRAAVDLTKSVNEFYSLVPLTHDEEVIAYFLAITAEGSQDTSSTRRKTWYSLAGRDRLDLVSARTNGGELVLATIDDDPDAPGIAYTLVTLDPDSGANFLQAGVRVGDTVRAEFGYSGDPDSYREFAVAEVVGEDALRLESGPAAPIPVGAKIEIWRDQTPTEIVSDIQARVASLAGPDGSPGSTIGIACRGVHTWPDLLGDQGRRVEGYFLSASLAGQAAALDSQRSLTRLPVVGFDDYSRNDIFSRDLLETLGVRGSNGTTVVTRHDDGSIVIEKCVSTADPDDPMRSSEMFLRNFDFVILVYKLSLEALPGQVNMTPQGREYVVSFIASINSFLNSGVAQSPGLGPKINDPILQSLEASEFAADTYVAAITGNFPLECNTIDLTVTASVGASTTPATETPASLA